MSSTASTSYFEAKRLAYESIIEKVWNCFNTPNALYVRGSSAKPVHKLTEPPWDVDLVFFVNDATRKEIESALELTRQFNERAQIQPLDIRVASIDNAEDQLKLAHVLLLLQDSSILLKGNPISTDVTLTKTDRLLLLNTYFKSAKKRIDIIRQDIQEQRYCQAILQEKTRRLYKTIARSASMIMFVEGNPFSRSPKLGLKFISELVGKGPADRVSQNLVNPAPCIEVLDFAANLIVQLEHYIAENH